MERLFTATLEQQEREQRRARETEADHRAWHRQLFALLARAIVWYVAGLGAILWSASTTDGQTGRLALAAGVFIGYGGPFLTIGIWWFRATQRGDL
jgi:hypothetical protein